MNNQSTANNAEQQKMIEMVSQSGVDPQKLYSLGKLAEKAIADKTFYPKFINEMVNQKLIDQSKINNKIDYRLLMSIAALGKIALSNSPKIEKTR